MVDCSHCASSAFVIHWCCVFLICIELLIAMVSFLYGACTSMNPLWILTLCFCGSQLVFFVGIWILSHQRTVWGAFLLYTCEGIGCLVVAILPFSGHLTYSVCEDSTNGFANYIVSSHCLYVVFVFASSALQARVSVRVYHDQH